MIRTTRHNTERFCLTSWGGGVALGLLNKTDGRSVFVQGDDATTMSLEIESLEINRPDLSVDDVLAEVWDTYEAVAEREFA